MADHDSGYKLLFSHARMIADLIRGFVDEDWVADLDFSTLEKVGGSFTTQGLRHRENDSIWRLRRGKNEWVYVYVLLEFQSTVDPYMGVRIMTYVCLLYEDLIRHKLIRPGDKLPPVLPIVFYNGMSEWRAARNVAALIEEMPAAFERHRPRLEYLLLDAQRMAEGTLPLRNVASAVIRLEQSRALEDVKRVVEALLDWLQGPEEAELKRAFTSWLQKVLLPARLPGVEVPEVSDLQEVKSMLAENALNWTEGWKQEGRQETLRQFQEILVRQLEKRFGLLSEGARSRLEAIDSVEALGEQIARGATARSLDELGLG
jgi:hypothetical protein